MKAQAAGNFYDFFGKKIAIYMPFGWHFAPMSSHLKKTIVAKISKLCDRNNFLNLIKPHPFAYWSTTNTHKSIHIWGKFFK